MWLVLAIVVTAVLGVGLWRAAVHADRIEDDSRYAIEESGRRPYGSSFLAILRGRRAD